MDKQKILAAFLIVFTVLLSSFAFYIYQLIYTPNILTEADNTLIFTIEKTDEFSDVQRKLADAKIMNDAVAFGFVAKLMGYHKRVQPGHYTLQPKMTNVSLIRYLQRGNPIVKVQFHSARGIENMGGVFSKKLFVDSADFVSYFTGEQARQLTQMDARNIIGLFLPNTYEFYYRASNEEILTKMKKNYDRFWSEERKKKAEKLNLSQQQVVTLASIVRAETSKIDEARKIAGLYYNRLEKRMLLQADPTLIFAHNDYSIRRVRKGHREIDSPYNTYKYKGLPPGPINMPSIDYVDAVLDMEHHDYIFFCADASFNGYHVFATNYDEHLHNARKLWKVLNQRNIN